MERVESGPGLVRPGRVVGWLGPVDHGGVGRRVRLVVGVVGGSDEGGPGGSVGTRRSGGGRVVLLVLLGVKVQKPAERAVGIGLEKRVIMI